MIDPTNATGLVGNPNAVPPGTAGVKPSTPVKQTGGRVENAMVMPGGFGDGPAGGPQDSADNNGGTNTPAGNFVVANSSVANNADYVGGTNVTDMTTDIANNTSGFIDDQGANLSDQVPDIDANAPGTNLDGSDYGMDADGLNQSASTGAVDTASDVTKPNEASGYDAATTADQVANNLADAATMETNEDAIVDPEGIVLDQQGYRFFQSSFSPDEKGTVLSVNHDFWGTWVTYIGYFMLYMSLMGIFFIGKTRFKDLSKTLDKIKIEKNKLTLLILLAFSIGWAQDHDHVKTQINFDSLVVADAFSKEHAAKFGSLVIQDMGGRMKPANTFSSELLRKVSKSDTYNGMDSNQVLLSILNAPAVWYNIPVIYLKRGNDSIRSILGVNTKAKFAPLMSFFDTTGVYKLSTQLEGAYRTPVPNQFQKDFIEVDKRVNLLYSALEGKVLRIFPIPEDENNKWVSFPELEEANFKGTDSLYVRNVLPLYFQSLRTGKATKDYKQASDLLESLAGFQKRYGGDILPSEDKITAEIAYNKYDIFKKLFSWYLYVGALFFIILLIQIFKDSKVIRSSIFFFKASIGILFLLHTAGLIARWYISGHAPWSDAYESMIYVSWATMFFGLAFGRKSNLTMAATTFVAAMILMIAHWNWMDPAIANLQPVLDSYWLMIHVAVIVGSYGPFALSMIIGIVALLLILLTTNKNKARMALNIKELTIINELSLTVGLIMLTIGNFLGGMWANESWGRYWGWDPKETWALISIMIYAFVIHMRLIPALKSKWMFNFSSVLAFGSIMMTYFGVNFYLSGLHSYASGDKIITPDFVYYALFFVTFLGGASYWRFKKMYRK